MSASNKIPSLVAIGVSCFLAMSAASAQDEPREPRKIVTVAFGAGLNTAQPGNSVNHHVLPKVIEVKVNDVVNFVVSGLHVIRVFEKGVSLRDVRDAIPAECEINPPLGTPFPITCDTILAPGPVPVLSATPDPATTLGLPLYYNGLNSLAPPPAPPFAPISVDQNRVEGVLFSKPGRYLVICAVLPHLNDGMFAWVEVTRKDAG